MNLKKVYRSQLIQELITESKVRNEKVRLKKLLVRLSYHYSMDDPILKPWYAEFSVISGIAKA